MTDSDGRAFPWRRVLLLYCATAAVMTWPLLLELGTHVPRGDHDLWQNYWNLWWWKVALWERHQSPYMTDLLFFPEVVPLGNHTHSPANMLLTLPINVLLGVPAALQLAVFAGFVFAAFGAFLLAREYAAPTAAAFLAGISFAFLPQHVEQSLEHLNLASYQAMPLFLWALVRCCRRGGRRWWVLAGVFFALNTLLSWHNGLLSIPLGVAVALFEGVRGARPRRAVALDALKAALLAAAFVAPFLWPVVRDTLSGAAELQKGFAPKPISPLFLLVPHPGHPVWGEATAAIYERFRTYHSVGFVAYLGIVGMSLAVCALVVPRRGVARGEPATAQPNERAATALWVSLSLFFLVLSFGETLRFARGVEAPWLPLPFYWLKHIPLFGLVRVPNRFLVPAALALAVLVAMGAQRLARWLPRRRQTLFLAALAALVALDLAWLPYPTREVPRPAWIAALRDLPPGAVLDIPSGHRARAADDLFLQTLHERPIASGYLSTRLSSVEGLLERFPVLRRVFETYPPKEAYSGPSLPETVRALGVRVVVVHLDRSFSAVHERLAAAQAAAPHDVYTQRLHNPEKGISRAALDRFRRELTTAFGAPVFASPEVEIFVVPE